MSHIRILIIGRGEPPMQKKKFLKTNCKVEFSVPAENVQSVQVIGDFNEWDESATPMEKKGKAFKATLDLNLNQQYEFRYLVNGADWRNDGSADGTVPNAFGTENAVVSTLPPQ
jgi:1,4-alpha-glucan branching enzyme